MMPANLSIYSDTPKFSYGKVKNMPGCAGGGEARKIIFESGGTTFEVEKNIFESGENIFEAGWKTKNPVLMAIISSF